MAGLTITRRFTREGEDPYAQLVWERRDAQILDDQGQVYFEQRGVEVPRAWSATATNIVAQKYFRGVPDTTERESSVRQLIERVAGAISTWGRADGYFADEAAARAFHDELVYLLLHQRMAFNSPVWFNVGVEERPQCSACFINRVEDTMESIMSLARTEGLLFKYGSGTGTNFSTLRSARERLSGGGSSSGPVSFMRGFDAFAGAVKSGGKTRRAAKMVVMDVDHPDIVEFVECKAREERKAWALIDAGYDGGFNVPGGAYETIAYQNANHSVRVSDEFMRAVEAGRPWQTHAVLDGRVMDELDARALFRRIAIAAHQCGDPGLQFDDVINAYHTCPSAGRIRASNPCAEYMFLDDSACNLASLNLRRFQDPEGDLEVEDFRHAIAITILAQEILVDHASYPTDEITRRSRRFRPLGLGYANLGAFLMARGLPYDSAPARAYAAGLTALLSGEAYATSAQIARDATGPFAEFAGERSSFLAVLERQRAHLEAPAARDAPGPLRAAAGAAWDQALAVGGAHGLRNAQTTAIAPTGTIAFMMDCDTTGIEPDLGLIKYKRLVGGGLLKIVNQTVPEALARLGYHPEVAAAILAHLEERDGLEDAPQLQAEHLAVFDCAFPPPGGTRSIAADGHLQMMAACQPFLSGAISKTVNLPPEASVAEVERIYLQAWRLGLKAISIYRDGCKRTQPLSTTPPPRPRIEGPVDAPPCWECGVTMKRTGSCFTCPNCGDTSSCA